MGTSPDATRSAGGSRPVRRAARLARHRPTTLGHGLGLEEARSAAREIGYPLLVRPSYVLGGRGMGIVYDDAGLARYVAEATAVSRDHPVYLDKFLEGAVE
ncbi:MAG: hypothetical protein ACLTDR_07295 [Adlercreutzia equolifaciens]